MQQQKQMKDFKKRNKISNTNFTGITQTLTDYYHHQIRLILKNKAQYWNDLKDFRNNE